MVVRLCSYGVSSITNRVPHKGMRCSHANAGLDSYPRPHMKRQRIALWLLCASLIGFAPSAFACSTPGHANGDCCPTGQRSPCETPAQPAAARLDSTCCAAQAALSPAALGLPSIRKVCALRVPFVPAAGGSPEFASTATRFESPAVPSRVPAQFDRAQIYLLTGRLRL